MTLNIADDLFRVSPRAEREIGLVGSFRTVAEQRQERFAFSSASAAGLAVIVIAVIIEVALY